MSPFQQIHYDLRFQRILWHWQILVRNHQTICILKIRAIMSHWLVKSHLLNSKCVSHLVCIKDPNHGIMFKKSWTCGLPAWWIKCYKDGHRKSQVKSRWDKLIDDSIQWGKTCIFFFYYTPSTSKIKWMWLMNLSIIRAKTIFF